MNGSGHDGMWPKLTYRMTGNRHELVRCVVHVRVLIGQVIPATDEER